MRPKALQGFKRFRPSAQAKRWKRKSELTPSRKDAKVNDKVK